MENKINTIIKGDSIDELKKMPDNSIDFIFADPPYFMQTEGDLMRYEGTVFNGVDDEWDKFSSFKEYDKFSLEWLMECKRVLKKDGSICVIGSFQNIYRLGYFMQNLDYWILNDIVWNKLNPVPNFAGKRFCNSHETMIWAAKSKTSKVTFNYKTMKYLNGGKQEKSVWNIALCTGKERLKDENGKKIHSTQKPEELLYKIILAATKPEDVILDPFFGTGTTGAVAKKLGRNYIGIEREMKYIEAAEKRLSSIVPELDDISLLKHEIKPPKVPMKKLLDSGFISPGDKLFDKNEKFICTVSRNGTVIDPDTNNELSIHQMSAKALGKINHNGWQYFYLFDKDNGRLISLDELRYKYKE
ncbi:DNA-methyltransferase [Mycoplasma sp. Z244B]|uniref:DNA-methyltransferase n=1 Tax=Mycoplasma sp. Z244B TaxID=3401659 RepID=UPI003AB095B0